MGVLDQYRVSDEETYDSVTSNPKVIYLHPPPVFLKYRSKTPINLVRVPSSTRIFVIKHYYTDGKNLAKL